MRRKSGGHRKVPKGRVARGRCATLRECTHVEPEGQGWALFVNVLTWESPSPRVRPEVVRRWSCRPTPTQLKSTVRMLALDPRYFRTCARCRRFTLSGWFNHGRTCDSCMERFYGIIH